MPFCLRSVIVTVVLALLCSSTIAFAGGRGRGSGAKGGSGAIASALPSGTEHFKEERSKKVHSRKKLPRRVHSGAATSAFLDEEGEQMKSKLANIVSPMDDDGIIEVRRRVLSEEELRTRADAIQRRLEERLRRELTPYEFTRVRPPSRDTEESSSARGVPPFEYPQGSLVFDLRQGAVLSPKRGGTKTVFPLSLLFGQRQPEPPAKRLRMAVGREMKQEDYTLLQQLHGDGVSGYAEVFFDRPPSFDGFCFGYIRQRAITSPDGSKLERLVVEFYVVPLGRVSYKQIYSGDLLASLDVDMTAEVAGDDKPAYLKGQLKTFGEVTYERNVKLLLFGDRLVDKLEERGRINIFCQRNDNGCYRFRPDLLQLRKPVYPGVYPVVNLGLMSRLFSELLEAVYYRRAGLLQRDWAHSRSGLDRVLCVPPNRDYNSIDPECLSPENAIVLWIEHDEYGQSSLIRPDGAESLKISVQGGTISLCSAGDES